MTPDQWTPPHSGPRITTIDAHTEGEPFRVVTGGYPEIPGQTLLARHRDWSAAVQGLREGLQQGDMGSRAARCDRELLDPAGGNKSQGACRILGLDR